jgi:hypothetical protein
MAAAACRFRDSFGIVLSHREASSYYSRAVVADSKGKATSSRRDPDLDIAKTDFNYGPKPEGPCTQSLASTVEGIPVRKTRCLVYRWIRLS